MAKTADVRRPVRPRAVPNRNIPHSESENRGREKQLKIPERIEIAEMLPPGNHPLVIVAGQKLRSA
jgi:hypothetical protein